MSQSAAMWCLIGTATCFASRGVFDLLRIAGQAPESDMQLRHVDQRHAPEQPRPGIPAGIGLHAGVHRDDDGIRLAGIDQPGDVHLEGRIAVVVQRGLGPVDLDGGVHHRAVQPQRDPLPRPFGGDVQLPPVVGDAGVEIAAGRPRGRFGIDVALDHVIVGQVHDAFLKLAGQAPVVVDESPAEAPAPVDIDTPHVLSLPLFCRTGAAIWK